MSTEFGACELHAYLLRLYFLLIEISEGQWCAAGRAVSALDIGHLIGTDENPERWSEMRVNTANMQAAAS